MAEPVRLSLHARPLPPALPPLLTPASRSVGGPADEFLPPGYLVPKAVHDLSPSARGSAEGVSEQTVSVASDDELLVIEMSDRSTLITTASALKASLLLSRPELIGADGQILFDQLRLEGAASRGLFTQVVGTLVDKVYTLGVAWLGDKITDEARAALGGKALELGVSWAGTKALMWAIEKRLQAAPGSLSRWSGARGGASELKPMSVAEITAAQAPDVPGGEPKPMLVFVHGTASTTSGSFGDLHAGERDVWSALERRFTGGIYAFEHHTLSASPIDNALSLVDALPPGARVSLVSHSRGGLVCDLLCLGDFDPLIPNYRYDMPHTGDADAAESERVIAELDDAHAQQRRDLHTLAARLRASRIVVQRYLRVASPARGTRLASGNFDVFLSGLLTLIGQVPFFFGQPAYLAFKRVVLDIARNRTNPHLVPGIEAMLPDAPMARLLRDAPVRPGIEMAVIAGDIEGGHLLQRFGVLLTDFLLFDNVDNDLVVDTAAMLSGIAPRARARALFDRGAEVSHFRYFNNLDTRFALRDWLTSARPDELDAFQPLPEGLGIGDTVEAEDRRLREIGAKRGTDSAKLPVVVLLPGVMGSHLWVHRKDRVWFDPLDIAAGGLADIAWGQPGVEAEKLFGMFYGKLAEHLATSHRVERFAYDWRQPLDVLGERFGQFLSTLMAGTDQPIRLLAHSMGGLVVRACIHVQPSVMEQLMRRDGARLVMLGTPHQGAHSMVENLLGKGDTLRTLVRLDLKHDLREVLDIVAAFRGPLQLLPKPGFVDTFQGMEEGGLAEHAGARYGQAQTWQTFRGQVKDFWFGDGQSATPTQEQLDAGSWLWRQDGEGTPALPAAFESKSIYVFGVAPNTPCGVRLVGDRLKMVGTTKGDGTVTWDSGRIGHVGRHYYMPAEHGALLSTQAHFPAIAELLASGVTGKLMTAPPAVRAIEQARPVTYDAGPPTVEDGDAMARALMGGTPRARLVARPSRRLEVTVKAMDLRFVTMPILVGQYQHDPIAGPQKLIDRELLDGDLNERYSLGLYAGPTGSATVVLRAPNLQERRRGSLSGAVVTGLGPYENLLSLGSLTEAVRAGALRYLLQVVDVLGKTEREVPLATLLIGYNSSANLTVADSVEALVRGVLEANAKFFETTRTPIRIARLDIVEIYLDTAITAVYALRKLAPKLAQLARQQRAMVICKTELLQGDGLRQRLYDRGSPSYWPRLIVTDADRREDGGAPDPQALPPGPTALAERGPTALANRLRFLYVGQRARAESVVVQRQPGLVEALVRQQIDDPRWKPDVGRMLFQLMVPNDFKDAARQLDRVVLVVDACTANLPWELMMAGDPDRAGADMPLAIRTPVVRQLETRQFRREVRKHFDRHALVIGNPSVQGFATAFGLRDEPPGLAGAEREADSVVAILGSMDYAVTREIGASRRASDVLAALYRQPYRFLHVSAHGVFDLRHGDGRTRSGVVLSDGLLITAAEIEAMETVPELVFLNCCHVGQIDLTTRDGNKLAASISRELIQAGVRCVIAAGWAVDDRSAQLFGETFYRELLLERRAFGEAVFEARKAVWKAWPEDITWGAFQAYGDAGWMAEPARDGSAWGPQGDYASPEEVLDELASLRSGITRKKTRLTARDVEQQSRSVRQLADRMPAAWLASPGVLSAFAATWAELGDHEQARSHYLSAVQAEDRRGQVPIRDLEQLANVEARLGERQRDEAQIRRALHRLDELDQLVSADPGAADPPQGLVNAERCAMRGSAWKRIASLQARRVLEPAADAATVQAAGVAMREALTQSAAAYGRAEGLPGQPQFKPYLALNRLAIYAMAQGPGATPADAAMRDAALALAQQCGVAADDAFRRDGSFYNAVMSAEALLVQGLIDGRFGAVGDAGEQRLEEIAKAYAEVLSNLTLKPKELETVIDQLCLLSRFHDAFDLAERPQSARRAAEHARFADRLIALAERLHPGACRRDDRPPRRGRPAASAASGSAPAAAPVLATSPAPSARATARPRRTGAPKQAGAKAVKKRKKPTP